MAMKWILVGLLVAVAAWAARRQETKDQEKQKKLAPPPESG
jgi:hypothetical protein